MFTGLIIERGKCIEIEKHPAGDASITVASALFAKQSFDVGCSIACSGVCLTLREQKEDRAYFDVSKETLRCTTISTWAIGEAVNLECSLKLGDEIGGHLVSGHVDGLAKIEKIEPVGQSYRYQFALEKNIGCYVAQKGSIAVDGISLTVNAVSDKEHTTFFEVNIIPHTYAMTNLSEKKEGSLCNIEVDMLMRYVQRIVGSSYKNRA